MITKETKDTLEKVLIKYYEIFVNYKIKELTPFPNWPKATNEMIEKLKPIQILIPLENVNDKKAVEIETALLPIIMGNCSMDCRYGKNLLITCDLTKRKDIEFVKELCQELKSLLKEIHPKKQAGVSAITGLPKDVSNIVAGFLNPRDIIRMKLVNKKSKQAIDKAEENPEIKTSPKK